MSLSNKFAAQQLSKGQMNKVIGGEHRPDQLWECRWDAKNGYTIIREEDFEKLVADKYVSGIKEIECKQI